MFFIILAFMIIIGIFSLAFDVSILGAIFIMLGTLILMILTLLLAGFIKHKAKDAGKSIDKMMIAISVILIIVGIGMCIYGFTGNFGVEVGNYTDTKGNTVLFLQDVIPAFTYIGMILAIIGVIFFIIFKASSKETENNNSNNHSSENNSNNFTPHSNDITAFCFECDNNFVILNLESNQLFYKCNSVDTNELINEATIKYKDITMITHDKSTTNSNSIAIYCTDDIIIINTTSLDAEMATRFVNTLEKYISAINPDFNKTNI
ncbi:MAG: hypothetical protein E7678_00055 [Ruminococcaceae bacterium]|nr:hypothetical protein [Oscillospiraceae bacterium]